MKCCGLQPVTPIRLVHHAPGAPGLRWLGLGPDLHPSRALLKLQRLFDRHAFWARGRSFSQLRRLLAGSDAVVSIWRGKRLVGFGRAASDGRSRACASLELCFSTEYVLGQPDKAQKAGLFALRAGS